MNKSIKIIVAMVLVIGTVSVAASNTSTNLLTTRAYASTNESDIESLELLDASGNKIKLYDSDEYDNRVHGDDLDDREIYFAKTSSSTVNIDVDGPSKRYVRIFKGTTGSTKGKEIGENIKLSNDSSNTLLVIKVYGDEPEENVTYDNDNYDLKSTYKIKVKYAGDSSSNSSNSVSAYSSSSELTAEDYDSIYLDRMSIDGNSIELLRSKINYSYNVNSHVEKVTIRAVPEDDETDEVEINNNGVDDTDNYKKTVDLKNGENKIEINLTNEDDDERVYTLTINRGNTSVATESTNKAIDNSNTKTDAVAVTNKWIQVNGQWQYKDASGTTVKNSWIQNYYMDENGNVATGWLAYNGSWYYLGTDGTAKTGWQLVNGSWYYLNNNGSWNTTQS